MYKRVSGHPKKTTTVNNNEHIKDRRCHRTNGTFGFAQYTGKPFAKPKEPFFANAPDDNNKLDIDKLLKNMFNILHHFRARLLPLTH